MVAEKERKVNRVSFSLEEEYQSLLAQIATRGRRSMTDELRVMIDRRASELGMTPVVEFEPKFSASAQMFAAN